MDSLAGLIRSLKRTVMFTDRRPIPNPQPDPAPLPDPTPIPSPEPSPTPEPLPPPFGAVSAKQNTQD